MFVHLLPLEAVNAVVRCGAMEALRILRSHSARGGRGAKPALIDYFGFT